MDDISNDQLIANAHAIAKVHKTSDDVITGEVGCALLTENNNLYLGVSIHASCGIGFCAEHSAIAAMVIKEEFIIKKIVAVQGNGTVIPPCGRCRELIYQIHSKNIDTEIILGKNKVASLKDLLPEIWQEKAY